MNIREHRLKKITPKNEFLMKKCYADLFEKGIIPKELYLKVQRTNYVRQ